MGWFRVDDSFGDSDKSVALSADALCLWLLCGCWCRKPSNSQLNGFVPRAVLVTITKRRWAPERLEELASELVAANVGGTKAHGLWEPREGGWQFHDWPKYQPTDESPRSASEVASLAGKRSAEVRRNRFGTAQPNRSRTRSEQFDASSTEHVHRTELELSEPPRSQIPDPRDQRSDPKDLTGSARAESTARPSGSEATTTNDPEIPESSIRVNHAAFFARRRIARLETLDGDFGELCQAFEANQEDASMLPVQTHPSVVEVHKAYCGAVGVAPRRLGVFKKDSGVRAICALYAIGYDQPTLVRLAAMAGKDGWLMGKERGQTGRPLDVSALTPAKAGELLAIANAEAEAQDRKRRRREEELAREQEARRELEQSRNRPKPPPVDLGAMIANLANGGTAPKPAPVVRSEVRPSVTGRRLTVEELDAILEEEDRKKAGNA